MTRRALVTGGNGFVAQWAMRAMLARGWVVTAGGIGAGRKLDVLTAPELEAISWLNMDMTVQADVAAAVDYAAPDVILHLAGISHVPEATANPGYTYEVNTVGTVRLLAEVLRFRASSNTDPMVLMIGSAEQYGRHASGEMPLSEEMEQRPLTPYAASKVAQEIASLQAFRSDGVRVVCTRSFNHSGVGHAGHFLLPGMVARALALPPSGGRLSIGNGDIVRDFLHVTDVAAAYIALLEQGEAGAVYNVSSGVGVRVRDLAAAVLQRVGVTADITADATLTRPIDVPVLVGSNAKLRGAIGWAPLRSSNDIIDDLIHAATR